MNKDIKEKILSLKESKDRIIGYQIMGTLGLGILFISNPTVVTLGLLLLSIVAIGFTIIIVKEINNLDVNSELLIQTPSIVEDLELKAIIVSVFNILCSLILVNIVWGIVQYLITGTW